MAVQGRVVEFIIGDDGAGQRLDVLLSERVPALTRSRAQALLRAELVLVDGSIARASLRAQADQRVRVEIPDPTPARPLAEPIELSILHEDDDIVVVDKPAGLVVHPAPGNWSGTLVNALLGRYGTGFAVGGEERPGIVHRLDKDTSGVMIVARSDVALAHLQQQFQAHSVRKTYLALVQGAPPVQGSFDTPYGRHPRDRKRYTSKLDRAPRRAALSYRALERLPGATLVEVALGTGRTHQIRVQFADAGFAVVGDGTYGRGRGGVRFTRQALHAWRLSCLHPRSNDSVQFEAPVPRDMRELLARLRSESST